MTIEENLEIVHGFWREIGFKKICQEQCKGRCCKAAFKEEKTSENIKNKVCEKNIGCSLYLCSKLKLYLKIIQDILKIDIDLVPDSFGGNFCNSELKYYWPVLTNPLHSYVERIRQVDVEKIKKLVSVIDGIHNTRIENFPMTMIYDYILYDKPISKHLLQNFNVWFMFHGYSLCWLSSNWFNQFLSKRKVPIKLMSKVEEFYIRLKNFEYVKYY